MGERVITNFETVGEGRDEKKSGLAGTDIATRVGELSRDQIFTCGGRLFCVPKDTRSPRDISDADDFFAWLAGQDASVVWATFPGAIAKREFVRYFHTTVPAFDSISDLPHFPKIAGVYYISGGERVKPTGALDELVALWTPATKHDAALIKAAFCTPFWGGAPGRRPAFFIEGDGTDHGRGVGKTTLMTAIAQVSGGAFESRISEDVDLLKKRLLNGSNRARVITFDNVKSARVSSGDLEKLITCDEITGHKLRVGETQRKNLFTYVFTMNDVSLSTDLCQRAVRIHLKRNEYSGEWLPRLDALLERKAEIIADVGRVLCRKVDASHDLTMRFADWQKGVLNRIDGSQETAKIVIDRQKGVDADEDSKDDCAGVIRMNIATYRRTGYPSNVFLDPDTNNVLIARHVMCEWVRSSLNRKATNSAITRLLHMAHIPQLVDRDDKRVGVRYWRWLPDPSVEPIGAWRIDHVKSTVLASEHRFDGIETAPGSRGGSEGIAPKPPLQISRVKTNA